MGLLVRNPAMLLFTPKDAAKPVRKVMNMKEVQMMFDVLDYRKRLHINWSPISSATALM